MLAWGIQITLGERKRIKSINTTPGTVLTGISLPIIPDWAWVLVVPLLAMVRTRVRVGACVRGRLRERLRGRVERVGKQGPHFADGSVPARG